MRELKTHVVYARKASPIDIKYFRHNHMHVNTNTTFFYVCQIYTKPAKHHSEKDLTLNPTILAQQTKELIGITTNRSMIDS